MLVDRFPPSLRGCDWPPKLASPVGFSGRRAKSLKTLVFASEAAPCPSAAIIL